MKNLISPIKSAYLQRVVLLLTIFLVLASPLLWVEKGAVVLWVNQYRSPFCDYFFPLFTELGNGLFLLLVVIIFLFRSFFKALYLAISGVIHAILVWVGKGFLFPEAIRPAKFFAEGETIRLISGYDHHMHNSFPSGHTATAFCLAIALMIIMQKKWINYLLLLVAILVGFSRIYLIQHFYHDVYAGALIGSFSSILGWLVSQRLPTNNPDHWLNRHANFKLIK